jgi:phosphoribosyl-ATP pyrophosphohydrolase/phosphoribosyl-AMP cyclohydrolase
VNKIAQKLGEEAVELVIESKDQDDGRFLNEAADLLFHLLILLVERGYGLEDVAGILEERHINHG